MAGDLGTPSRGHERLATELDVNRRAKIDGISGVAIEPDPVVVPQVPDFRANKHRRDDAVRQGGGNAPGRFLLPPRSYMVRIVGGLGFVEQIGTEIEPVLNQFEVSIDLNLEFEICDVLAAGFVDPPPFRLRRQCDGERR